MPKIKEPTKGFGLVLPLGLYQRVQELAIKNKTSVHAYVMHIIWRETNWTPEKPTVAQNSGTTEE